MDEYRELLSFALPMAPLVDDFIVQEGMQPQKCHHRLLPHRQQEASSIELEMPQLPYY